VLSEYLTLQNAAKKTCLNPSTPSLVLDGSFHIDGYRSHPPPFRPSIIFFAAVPQNLVDWY
jgi:hypothetical protein